MKPFETSSSSPTELGKADEWIRELEKVASATDSHWTDEIRRAFFRWVVGSMERVGHVLFLGAFRNLERQLQGSLLHESRRRSLSQAPESAPNPAGTIHRLLRGATDRVDPVQQDTDHLRIKMSTELFAICERGADARISKSIRRFVLELRQIFSLTPVADFTLWNAVYQRRPMEWEAMVSFAQDPILRTGLVYGAVQSGKTSLLKHWSHYWLRHPTEATSGRTQRVDSIYVDVGCLLGKALMSAQERASHYRRREEQAPLGNGLGFEEILVGQCEAVLVETVVLEIQKRLAEYFRTLLTGAGNEGKSCPRAGAFSIPVDDASGSTRGTLEFRVTCCVVAVALWVARMDARRRTYRLVKTGLASAHVRESDPQFGDVFLELIQDVPRALSAMLSAHHISNTDGALWRSVYAVCFDCAQPVLIFDNFEDLQSECLVHATVQASLNVAAEVARGRLERRDRWKVLIAIRDFTGMTSALASLPSGSWMAIGLTQRPSGAVHDNAMLYLPLPLSCKREIVRSRLELALRRYAEAESRRLSTTTLLAGLAQFPTDDPEGGGSDCISSWLEETFEPVAVALCELLRREHEGRRRKPESSSPWDRRWDSDKDYMQRPVARFKRLMRMLRRDGRSQEDAEDLIQEALLRVEQYAQRFEVRSAEAFLTRTVRNLSINQYHHDTLVVYADEPVEQLADSLVTSDPCADPERRLDAQQRLEQITRVLDAESQRTREIFFAHRSGHTYREIASAYGIGERTVEKHIARALFLLMQVKESLRT